LRSVIRVAKTLYYESIIQKSTNKVKTTWDIVKSHTNNKIITTKPNIRNFKNNYETTNAFNQYFSTVAEKLIKKLLKGKLYYLY